MQMQSLSAKACSLKFLASEWDMNEDGVHKILYLNTIIHPVPYQKQTNKQSRKRERASEKMVSKSSNPNASIHYHPSIHEPNQTQRGKKKVTI